MAIDAVELVSVSKNFGSKLAVDEVTLSVPEGATFGILGPNGAGKTTILSLLVGRLQPTAGSIRVAGEPVGPNTVANRRRLGVVPESHPKGMWRWMSGADYLRHFAGLFGVDGSSSRIEELSEYVGLGADIVKPFSTYSRGMLQRLSLARALIHDPKILVLDEAISGLDPSGVKMFRDIVVDQKGKGRTIVISSHLLSEIEKVCDRVAVISRGRLLAERGIDSAVAAGAQTTRITLEVDVVPSSLLPALREMSAVTSADLNGNTVVLEVVADTDVRQEISKAVSLHECVLVGLKTETKTLEDYYIDITEENVADIAGINRADENKSDA